MFRFLLCHFSIGLIAAIALRAGLYFFDVGGLASLVDKSAQGGLALVLLGVGLTTLFAPLALHTGLAREAAEADDAQA